MRFVVVGCPGHRRAEGFRAAALALGCGVEVVSWSDVLRDVGCLDGVGRDFELRLDSYGEEEAAVAAILARGGSRVAGLDCERTQRSARPGEVLAPRQLHEGFLDVLASLETWAAERPDVTVQQPFETIRRCFDKRVSQRMLRDAGIPVPPILEVDGVQALLQAHERQTWVKLSSGSSASGLGVLVGKVFITTLRDVEGARFNSLQLQHWSGVRRDTLLEWLFREGVQVERGVSRARLDGAFFDLRVLIVGGEARFLIVRQARHLITNLHLGGWRGEPEAARKLLGDRWSALVDLCRQVGALFPHTHLGLDVAVGRGGEELHVLEVNAFGDLLPGLQRDGLDVYGVEIISRLPNQGGRVLHSL